MDFPPDLPPPVETPAAVLEQCIGLASHGWGVHPFIIASVMKVENGKVGTISPNSDGSYDLGIMQLNTINLEVISKKFPGIGWEQLVYSPCVNIGVGTWFLSERIKSANGDIWKGVGNYHSKTPKYHNRYLKKVQAAYDKIMQRYYAILRK